jgi:hypothetical protein
MATKDVLDLEEVDASEVDRLRGVKGAPFAGLCRPGPMWGLTSAPSRCASGDQ